MSEAGSFESNLIRGRLLREQHRYKEAESYLGKAIQEQPDAAEPYYELAFCYCNTTRAKEALTTVDRALSLAPMDTNSLALRGWIIGNLQRHKEAITAAEAAMAFNPTNLLAINTRTRALVNLRRWKEAEASALYGVSLDPRGSLTVNLLAFVYRAMGKSVKAAPLLAGLLAKSPNDPYAHNHLGWLALETANPRQAQIHFREALRLAPGNEVARQGMLQALHARVWFYRWYLQIVTSASISTTRRMLVFVSLYGLFIFIMNAPADIFPAGWAWLCAAFYLSFILAKPLGDFFLLFDSQMRHCLSRRERIMGIFSFIMLAFVFVCLGLERDWLLLAIGMIIPISFISALIVNRMDRQAGEEILQ